MRPADYSNTIIYRISCKDPTVSGIYVGHTTDFIKRSYAHERSSNDKNNNVLLYRTIRQYGGWDNWDMKIVDFFNCKNQTEAREKEQEYFIRLNANLNSVEPMPQRHTRVAKKATKEEIVEEEVVEKEIVEEKVMEEGITMVVEEEVAKETTKKVVVAKKVVIPKRVTYYCQVCELICQDKTKYETHIRTNKHKTRLQDEVARLAKYKCVCGKKYSHRQGLFVHKKVCQGVKPETTPDLTKLVIDLVKSNKQLVEAQSQTLELQQQFLTFMNNQKK